MTDRESRFTRRRVLIAFSWLVILVSLPLFSTSRLLRRITLGPSHDGSAQKNLLGFSSEYPSLPAEESLMRKDSMSSSDVNCGCPSTCDDAALSQLMNGLPFSCGERIKYLMDTYGDSHTKACSAAVQGKACGPECDPDRCIVPTKNDTVMQPHDVTLSAIFFNAYVPPHGVGGGPENGIRIIKEQLEQRQELGLQHVPVFYTLIGENVSARSRIFSPNCHMLKHAKNGSEELTLQSLYDYCTLNPSARVAYIHDKGSFSRNYGNEIRRKYTTKGVLSKACRSFLSTECNICSLGFSALPTNHAPGNMWSADCSYIQKLVPPMEFERKMNEMYTFLKSCDSNLTCSIQPDMTWPNNSLSLGRYAMEHWAYSHPQVRLCESMRERYPQRPPLQDWTPQLIRGPKRIIQGIGGIWKSPWFKMEGRLYQYNYLYGSVPPDDSWFWSVYEKHKMSSHSRATLVSLLANTTTDWA